MPRGGHKVKVVKPVQAEKAAPAEPSNLLPTISKIRLGQNFLSRTTPTIKPSEPLSELPVTPQDTSFEWSPKLDLQTTSVSNPANLKEVQEETDIATPNFAFDQPSSTFPSKLHPTIVEDIQNGPDNNEAKASTSEASRNRFDSLSSESTTSLPAFSKSSASIYSRASSIHSSASSVYSSEASIYSFEDCNLDDLEGLAPRDPADATVTDPRLTVGVTYNHIPRPVGPRRLDSQDAAAKQRSILAKKAALFKNSRLSPELPPFITSLPTWSMVCRAAKASQDCYDSQVATRQGTYTAADSSKGIKAMIVDDHSIDGSRVITVSIRGTQSQSLKDWNVNTSANPTKPTGFLDEEDNACHAGFLQVAKAMVGQIATQLRDHPALPQCPTLLFTGHSAGGAIAAILYSHMLSTIPLVQSELTALTNQFSSISCITFGAPPVSQVPLLRRENVPGVFLAFANEGDLVLRTSNSAYFKSLAKLMTASPPPPTNATTTVAPPPVKVIRGSRGATVYRAAAPVAPPTPWEELPLWPTPAPSLCNAGEIILLRDMDGKATASPIASEDLREVIFGDLAQHTIEMYLRRVKDLAVTAMFGRPF